MLYSGFITLPRSIFWSAYFNDRSDNLDVIRSYLDVANDSTDRFRTLKTWIIRLLALDGLLPIAVVAVPQLIQFAFPDDFKAFAIVATLLLAIGCIYRFYTGRHHILTNHCGRSLRIVQTLALLFGIVVMVVSDCVMMVLTTIPGNANLRSFGVLILYYLVYIVFMIVALYPGRIARDTTNFTA